METIELPVARRWTAYREIRRYDESETITLSAVSASVRVSALLPDPD